MNPQKNVIKAEGEPAGTYANGSPRKPRRSIKVEGNCLNALLRDGCAKVIDANKLGKRLSSEIWNSFGAIQVADNFSHPSIETRIVADECSTTKLCKFFVACSRCYSVFKYDGHAYGTTGLVKHVKNCPGKFGQRTISDSANANHATNNSHSVTSFPNTTTAISFTNGPVTTRRKTSPNKATPASLKHLIRVIEELKCEQAELRQKLSELFDVMSSSYVGPIHILSNEGDKVEDQTQRSG